MELNVRTRAIGILLGEASLDNATLLVLEALGPVGSRAGTAAICAVHLHEAGPFTMARGGPLGATRACSILGGDWDVSWALLSGGNASIGM